LQFAITVCLKCKEEVTNLAKLIWLMMIMAHWFWIVFVYYQYQEGNLWCYTIFPFFLKDIWKNKILEHAMTLDLKPSSNNLFYWLWRRCEHYWRIWQTSLYFMLLKCYHYSHPMAKFEIGCANQTTNVDSNLNFSLTCMLINLRKFLQSKNLFCEQKLAKWSYNWLWTTF
jgi:hypothetical protein